MSDVGYIRIPAGGGAGERPAECDPAARLNLIDGMWQCGACALAWDDGDKKPPCAKATYSRLARGALAEAVRIESTQAALVAAGLRQFRDQAQLQRAMELRKLAQLAVKVKNEKEAGE